MRWEREEYPGDDGVRWYWKLRLGDLGEICVDRAEWIDDQCPWLVCWYVGEHETGIGRANTDDSAKRLAEAWLRIQATKIGNVLAEQPRVDEE
jgi:hypothetical protein